jgi:prepilin-type N-terminal cleavage/methylation domain-containing protein
MCQDKKLKTAPRAGSLAVDWHDCAWVPAIVIQTPSDRPRLTNQLPATLPFLHTGRRRSIPLKTMKMPSLSARRPRAGFTLIELLVVIAIIGILAAMLLAVLPGVMNSGKKTKARLEAQAIATAIEQYDSAYGRFPVSAALQSTLQGLNWTGDFTYGGSVFSNNLAQLPAGYSMYTTNNSEVIAILMNLTNYPNNSTATANVNYQKNPQKTIFLIAKMSGWDPLQGGTPQPGVGSDLVYRDPWGNPYIISMDLNYDDQTKDAFYCLNAVSGFNNTSANPGLNGLVNPDTTKSDNFQYHGKVMVWSAGQDGKIDPTDPATDWENKNNVLSW